MSTATQAIAVLKSAIQEQRNLGIQWLSWGLGLLAVVVGAAIAIFADSINLDKRFLLIGLSTGMIFGVLGWMWWMYIVSNALRQSVTAVSRLVPAQRSAVAYALTLVWLLLCGGATAALSLVAGKGLVAWLICSVILSFYIAALRYPVSWFIWVLCLVTPALGLSTWFITAYEWVNTASNSLGQSIALVLLSLLLWCVVLITVLSRRSVEQLRSSPFKLASIKGTGGWSTALRNPQQSFIFQRSELSWVVNAWARASTRATAPLARRLSLSLGHIFNPLAFAIQAFFVVVVLIVIFSVMSLHEKPSANLEQILSMFCIIFIGGFLSTSVQALWQTRREQALMCLLPGVPRGQALNQLLFSMLIRRHIASSLISVAGIVVLLGLFTSAWIEVLATAGMALLVIIFLCAYSGLIDYSSYKGPNGALMVLNMFGGMCLWQLLKLARDSGYLTPTAILTLLYAIGIFAWRWRVMSSAPQAWPTGRLATFGNKNYNAE
jgi:hypothetical protein